MQVVAIAAVARNGVIGRGGDVPWHVPGDWRRFRAVTTGHVLVMGRTTYEGIGRPLPGRTTIVVTRNTAWTPHGVDPAGHGEQVHVVPGVPAAVDLARRIAPERICWIAGGGHVYGAAMPLLTGLDISEIPLSPEGDTWFPEIPEDRWRVVRSTPGDGFVSRRYAPVLPVGDIAIGSADPGPVVLTPVGDQDEHEWATTIAGSSPAVGTSGAAEEAGRWERDGVASWLISAAGRIAGAAIVRPRASGWAVSVTYPEPAVARSCGARVAEWLALLDPAPQVRLTGEG